MGGGGDVEVTTGGMIGEAPAKTGDTCGIMGTGDEGGGRKSRRRRRRRKKEGLYVEKSQQMERRKV